MEIISDPYKFPVISSREQLEQSNQHIDNWHLKVLEEQFK